MEKIKCKTEVGVGDNAASPHYDDTDWSSMHEGIKFYEDVNGGEQLDKDKVIAARKLEMQFFKKMGVYSKVDKKRCPEAQWQGDHYEMDRYRQMARCMQIKIGGA